MGRNNKVRKFAEMKRTLKAKDKRLKQPEKKKKLGYSLFTTVLLDRWKLFNRKLFIFHSLTPCLGTHKKANDGTIIERQLPKVSTALFFKYNEQLGK